jgi:hypothetical protein
MAFGLCPPILRGAALPVSRKRRTQLITVLTPTPNCAAADGADVINISSGQLTPAGEAQRILADAVRSCSRADKLIVAKPSPRRQPWSADNGGKIVRCCKRRL